MSAARGILFLLFEWRQARHGSTFRNSTFQERSSKLLAELKVCSSTRNLERGTKIHAEAVATGNHSCLYVATVLVNMYAKCGSLAESRQVFDSISKPNVVSWTALILGYAQNGEGLAALELFARMKSTGCIPNTVTYVATLKACTYLRRDECLKRGKEIHSEIGCRFDVYLQNTLIDMYAKCGSMADAREVFDSMKHPDVVSWNALLLGYAENGESDTPLNLFETMQSQGCTPDRITFVAAMKACISLADGNRRAECLERAKQIHSKISCNLDVFTLNTLIGLYAKCGSMTEARKVFHGMKHPDVVSWTALISGYAENGESATALDLFATMRAQGCAPDRVTFVAALNACASLALEEDGSRKEECLERGKRIHSEVNGDSDVYVQSSLIDMYVKCGSIAEARRVFDTMKCPDAVSWNALCGKLRSFPHGITASSNQSLDNGKFERSG